MRKRKLPVSENIPSSNRATCKHFCWVLKIFYLIMVLQVAKPKRYILYVFSFKKAVISQDFQVFIEHFEPLSFGRVTVHGRGRYTLLCSGHHRCLLFWSYFCLVLKCAIFLTFLSFQKQKEIKAICLRLAKASGHMSISRGKFYQLIGKHSPVLCCSIFETFTTK